MGRQRSAVGAAFLRSGLGGFRRVLLVLLRFLLGDRRLDILQRQLHLLVIKLFGPPPKLRALKLPQEVVQPIVLRQRRSLFNRRVALATSAVTSALQGVEIIREGIDRLTRYTNSNSRMF